MPSQHESESPPPRHCGGGGIGSSGWDSGCTGSLALARCFPGRSTYSCHDSQDEEIREPLAWSCHESHDDWLIIMRPPAVMTQWPTESYSLGSDSLGSSSHGWVSVNKSLPRWQHRHHDRLSGLPVSLRLSDASGVLQDLPAPAECFRIWALRVQVYVTVKPLSPNQ